MWFSSIPYASVILISLMTILPSSNEYTLDGSANTFGCCMLPCLPKASSCDCNCGFPLLPQLPQLPLPPPFTFPQFPAYPSGSYVTPNGGNARQVENGYLQQPSSYQTSSSISNQLHPSYQGAGAHGYSVKQFEQQTGTSNGYATGPSGVDNGNFGDYSSTYNFPQIGQNHNRFGALPSQLPLSGTGQYMRGPLHDTPQSNIPNDPVAVPVGTTGIEYNLSPTTADYEEKTKHF
ncbi:unnamed protein product [Onchocerca ochengi]|uniref:Uncharacterized protein n=1 Tax=Onchocerca ochengi TaxID=42157 RepID=A0A182E180_ONCOC|nr:unnamed protein product [Onchocerca ochengi]